MDFDTDTLLVGDTNAEASGSGTFPPNLAALPSPAKVGKNPTGINGKRPSRMSPSCPGCKMSLEETDLSPTQSMVERRAGGILRFRNE